MRILLVASECAPFVKTGGLADVVGALPKALGTLGIDARILLPAYANLSPRPEIDVRYPVTGLHGAMLSVGAARAEGLDLLLLEAPHLYDRPGGPYLSPDGYDWPDNHRRFGTLGLAAANIAREGVGDWRPDVVHLHDWQAGLAAAYLKLDDAPAPPVATTIHNIAFQGLFDASERRELGLPEHAFNPEGYEFYGRIGFLKAGLVYADRITTVSPTYADELMSPEFGMGLEGVVASRQGDLTGIVNGIDTTVWDPANDPMLDTCFSAEAVGGKVVNRTALRSELGLSTDAPGPLVCVISRLTRQKGLDLLLEVLPGLVESGLQFAVLGTGETDLEQGFRAAETHYRGSVSTVIDFDERLAHRMQAGADAIVVPSRFEPCGLTQLCGLRYGTLPVVARTGGLADTVIDANDAALAVGCATGFQFAPGSAEALARALLRARDALANRDLWTTMVRRAMQHPVGWEASAAKYANLYASLAGHPAGHRTPARL